MLICHSSTVCISDVVQRRCAWRYNPSRMYLHAMCYISYRITLHYIIFYEALYWIISYIMHLTLYHTIWRLYRLQTSQQLHSRGDRAVQGPLSLVGIHFVVGRCLSHLPQDQGIFQVPTELLIKGYQRISKVYVRPKRMSQNMALYGTVPLFEGPETPIDKMANWMISLCWNCVGSEWSWMWSTLANQKKTSRIFKHFK